MKRNKFAALSCILLMSTMFLFGCQQPGEENKGTQAQESQVSQPPANATKPIEPSNDRERAALLAIFPQGAEESYYHGYAEFGYSLKFSEKKQGDNGDELIYKGYMIDGESDDPNEKNFTETIEIAKDGTVTSKIVKVEPFGLYDSLKLMDTVVEDQVILKLPLEVGNKWEQPFTFKGQELVAKTELVEVEEVEGKKRYKTELTVEGIEDFFDNKYVESRVYEEGKGLVEFENRFPLSLFSSDAPGLSEEDYVFSYSLIQE